jgi:hypothetical protein
MTKKYLKKSIKMPKIHIQIKQFIFFYKKKKKNAIIEYKKKRRSKTFIDCKNSQMSLKKSKIIEQQKILQ